MKRDATNIQPQIQELKKIFSSLERSYDEAAAHYGFSCEGCQDNCCTQRFFHHTLGEYFLLLEGVNGLEPEKRRLVLERARKVVDAYQGELAEGKLQPLMCPANFEGLCCIYEFRPMICRAHGLPHFFTTPDGRRVEGGGCERFMAGHKADMKIDRTGFYSELAALEREIRMKTGFRDRYKKTTAQMIVEMAGEFEEEVR